MQKHRAHSGKRERRFKAHHAILLLLLITVGAALVAFFWISTVEREVESRDISIKDVTYDRNTNKMDVLLINGLSTDLEVTSTGPEQTVLSIYPLSSESISCDFVSLRDLAYSSEGNIASRTEAILMFGGDRRDCLLTQGNYSLSIWFGRRRPVTKDFSVL